MTDENQLKVYETDTVGSDTCEGQELCEVVPKSDGSAEYEKGKAARDAKDYPEALKWFEMAAELGDTNAMITLGRLYEGGNWFTKDGVVTLSGEWGEGDGLKRSFEKARTYYTRATEAGRVFGEYALGDLYHYWRGPEKDLSKAEYHYMQGADKGEVHSEFELGVMYYNGKEFPQNHIKALHYFEKAVDTILNNERFVDEEIEFFYAEFSHYGHETIEKRISTSLEVLGDHFLTAEDYVKALSFFEKAFAFENVDSLIRCRAASMLGAMYYKGLGAEKNYIQSFRYYEMGGDITECGSHTDFLSTSEGWLGRMYFIGRGTQKDTVRAFELLEHAYSLGDQNAADTLCAIYANGYEVEKDLNKAIPYCEKGMEKDLCGEILGSLYYFTGQHEKSLQCLINEINDTKSESAARLLSVMYMDGTGIKGGRNFDIARQWGEEAGGYKRSLLQIMIDIPEMLNARPEKYYSIKLNPDMVQFTGFLGLASEEELGLFGNRIGDVALRMDYHN